MRALLLAILVSSCGASAGPGADAATAAAPPEGAPPPASPPPAVGVVVGSSAAQAAAAAPPVYTIDPAITTAVARIERAAYERDLRVIAGDRNDMTAPAHLAKVTRFVETELVKAGWTVRRETVQHRGRTADNLVAERAGSDPSRVVAVGAHLDTVPQSPGADDDGSGVAALLGIARATARQPTRATLRILAFCFEEDGLVGASHHVQSLSAAERARIVAMIDMDMIAYTDRRPGSQRYPEGIQQIVDQPLPDSGDFIAAVGLTGQIVLPALTHAQQYVPELRAGVVPLRRWQIFAAPDTMRGDHAPFWLAGIPAAQVGDTGDFRNPNYHQTTDRIETVDLEFATLVTRWIAASALTLAGVEPATSPGPR